MQERQEERGAVIGAGGVRPRSVGRIVSAARAGILLVFLRSTVLVIFNDTTQELELAGCYCSVDHKTEGIIHQPYASTSLENRLLTSDLTL